MAAATRIGDRRICSGCRLDLFLLFVLFVPALGLVVRAVEHALGLVVRAVELGGSSASWSLWMFGVAVVVDGRGRWDRCRLLVFVRMDCPVRSMGLLLL